MSGRGPEAAAGHVVGLDEVLGLSAQLGVDATGCLQELAKKKKKLALFVSL